MNQRPFHAVRWYLATFFIWALFITGFGCTIYAGFRMLQLIAQGIGVI